VTALHIARRRNRGRGVAHADSGSVSKIWKAASCFFYTGLSRSTEEILAEQTRSLRQDTSGVATYYSRIKEIGVEIYTHLKRGRASVRRKCWTRHWRAKKEIGAPAIASPPPRQALRRRPLQRTAGRQDLRRRAGAAFFSVLRRGGQEKSCVAPCKPRGCARCAFALDFEGK